MKRSEAIQMITSILFEHCDPIYVDYNHVDIAKMILSTLEDKGLKPPIQKKCPVLLTDKFEYMSEE